MIVLRCREKLHGRAVMIVISCFGRSRNCTRTLMIDFGHFGLDKLFRKKIQKTTYLLIWCLVVKDHARWMRDLIGSLLSFRALK